MKTKMNRNWESGFTLVEIMIVITIIALIAGLVGNQVMKRLEEAKQQSAKIQMKALETALDDYRRHNSMYPNTAQGLRALVEKPSSPPEPKNYDPDGYLKISGEEKNVPLDPWQNEYQYESEAYNKYKITCFGADGQAGGEGAAADVIMSSN